MPVRPRAKLAGVRTSGDSLARNSATTATSTATCARENDERLHRVTAKRPGLGGLQRPELRRLGLGLDELEAARAVDAPRALELALRPERQLAVADGAGEADALLDELRADAAAARGGLDDQQAQLRDAVAGVDAEDRADGVAVERGDPGALARGVVVRAKSATICATSASKLASKPYSRA